MTEHELGHFFTDTLCWCACGAPEDSAIVVRDILRLCPLYHHREEFDALITPMGAGQMILYHLNEAGLIEHGGAIGGAWITPLGEKVLAALNAVETEDDWDKIFWCFPDGPPGDCLICHPVEATT